MMFGWGDGMWGFGFWLAAAGLMVLVVGGIIALVLVLTRRPDAGQGTDSLRPAHHEAERILSERFARGEIDEEEFSTRRAALRRQ